MYYSNARWYDNQTGRFISLDPIRDGANWYVYANGNPLRYTDPTGLESVADDENHNPVYWGRDKKPTDPPPPAPGSDDDTTEYKRYTDLTGDDKYPNKNVDNHDPLDILKRNDTIHADRVIRSLTIFEADALTHFWFSNDKKNGMPSTDNIFEIAFHKAIEELVDEIIEINLGIRTGVFMYETTSEKVYASSQISKGQAQVVIDYLLEETGKNKGFQFKLTFTYELGEVLQKTGMGDYMNIEPYRAETLSAKIYDDKDSVLLQFDNFMTFKTSDCREVLNEIEDMTRLSNTGVISDPKYEKNSKDIPPKAVRDIIRNF